MLGRPKSGSYNPVGTGIETLLAWTSRRDGGERRMMEMRYGSDLNNAVEHWARNIGWNIGRLLTGSGTT